jgi:Domain of unknown function (DUF4440)
MTASQGRADLKPETRSHRRPGPSHDHVRRSLERRSRFHGKHTAGYWAEPHNEGTSNVNDTKQSTEDLASLEQLNKDFFQSDQSSDAKRFSEFLAEDFISQFPGITRNRDEFLEYIAKPRPFKDLAMHDVNIRILSDVALIHGRATYTLLSNGAQQEALYTDTYQKREGAWVCVAACAIAPGA